MLQGICSACGGEGTIHTCRLCGANVCSRCYNPSLGMCKKCSKKFAKPGFGKF